MKGLSKSGFSREVVIGIYRDLYKGKHDDDHVFFLKISTMYGTVN